jgi:hypothetical protein
MNSIDAMVEAITTMAALESGVPASVLQARGGINPVAALGYGAWRPMLAHWLPEEEAYLREKMGEGEMTDAEIGAALGRSAEAVRIRRQKRGFPARSKRPGWLTGHQAAKRMGWDVHKVIMLASRGLLRCERLPGQRGILTIREERLERWALDPVNWVYFTHEKVCDERLRRLLKRRAERWGDAWWTTGQAAAWHGVEAAVVQRAIERGEIPAVKWGNWWVRRSDMLRLGLYFAKNKGGGHVEAWSDEGDAFMTLSRAVGLSWQATARLMGRKHVSFRWQRMWEEGQQRVLVDKYGYEVEVDEERRLVWADWRVYAGRFPAVRRAMEKFRRWIDGDRGLFAGSFRRGEEVSQDLLVVRGVLANWALWYGLDAKLSFACHRPGRLERAVEALRGLGADPLGR